MKLTEEHKRKLSIAHYGKPHPISLATIEKIRKKNIGQIRSEETRKRLSESHKGKTSGMEGKHHSFETRYRLSQYKREKSSNWKGGTSLLKNTLPYLIRTLFEYIEWRNGVFKRDTYVCQECFERGGDLEAHHIRPFNDTLKEFLMQYSQFSPIEDKETLLRLAVNYQPFWEVGNGKTLCRSCHKDKTYNNCLDSLNRH